MIGAGGRITALVRRDLNFLASWDGNWTRGSRKKEKVHRKWKAWHFYKWFCSFLWTVVSCCVVLKPVLEKCDHNINKKLCNSLSSPEENNSSVKWFTFGLVTSKSWKVQRFTFDKQRTYHLSGGDLVCLEKFSQHIFSSEPQADCIRSVQKEYTISNKNAPLLKINADQNLRKMKWKNVGCCVWVSLGTVNHKNCPHMLCYSQASKVAHYLVAHQDTHKNTREGHLLCISVAVLYCGFRSSLISTSHSTV